MDTNFFDSDNVPRRVCAIPETKTHGAVEDVNIAFVDAHPSTVDKDKGIILLIHGFPETSYQFRKVIPLFNQAGYRVIVPDYRGAGDSSKPVDPQSYLKSRMATDLHYVVKNELKITAPIHVVGHDMGGMIAHAYANLFPADTVSVTWGECPIPGTKFYEQVKEISKSWHLPEDMVPGNEHNYIKRFFDVLTKNHDGVTPAVVAFYVRAYSAPGAMQAGHNTYLMFEEDAKENIAMRDKFGKSKTKCLVLNGDSGFTAAMARESAEEFYEDIQVATVTNSGHWVAEENPKEFVDRILEFVK